MAVVEATAVLAWGGVASGEARVTQLAHSKAAASCCFVGRMSGVGNMRALKKALAKLLGHGVVATT